MSDQISFASLAVEAGFIGLVRFVPGEPGLLLRNPELKPVDGCWHLLSSRLVGPEVLINQLLSRDVIPSGTLKILRGPQRGEYALEHISVMVHGYGASTDSLIVLETAALLCGKVNPEPPSHDKS